MEPTNITTDRIKLPFNFDVVKMLKETKILQSGNFEYYDVIPPGPLRYELHK